MNNTYLFSLTNNERMLLLDILYLEKNNLIDASMETRHEDEKHRFGEQLKEVENLISMFSLEDR